MIRYIAAVALAACLTACAQQPLVSPKPTYFQAKARTVVDWSTLSVDTAEAIVTKLRAVPDNSGTAHLIDGKPAPSSLAGRPLYLRPSDPTVRFNQVFNDLLTLELVRRGEVVTRKAAGATIINYDVKVQAYDHPKDYAYLPLQTTLIVGTVLGVAAATAANPIGGAFAAAFAIDMALQINQLLGDMPNAEVVLNIEVVQNQEPVFQDVDYFYIDRADAKFYLGVFGYGKPAPMETGPAAPAPAQTRVVRVTSE